MAILHPARLEASPTPLDHLLSGVIRITILHKPLHKQLGCLEREGGFDLDAMTVDGIRKLHPHNRLKHPDDVGFCVRLFGR
jgi:hypothetical protein